MSARRTRWTLLGIVLVALVLRLLHLYVVAPELLDSPPEVGMDRWLAMHVAQAVARGDWLGGWSADYDSTPGYGYLLAGLYTASGGYWVGPILLQVLLGALACLLVFDLGRRVWSPTAGVLAALLLAAYGPALFYETLLVKFSLVTVTVAALLVCVVRAGDGARLRWPLLAGVAFGLLQALRGNVAVVGLPCAWWIVRGHPLAGAGRRLLIFVGGAALILAPLAWRDHAAAERGRGASLWGIHFYIATQPGADGTYAPVAGVREDVVGHVVDARRIAEEAEARSLRPVEVSWYWFQRGLAAIRAQPLAYAKLELRKLRLALTGGEDGSFGDDFGDSVESSWVLRLPLVTFGSIVPLALLGVVLSFGRRKTALLSWFVIAYLISLLSFFITGRYRLPIVLPMIVLAACALDWLAARLRTRRGPAPLLALLLLAVALSFFAAGARDRFTFLGVLVLGVGAATVLAVPDGGRSLDEVPERSQAVETLIGHAWPAARSGGELAQPGTSVSQ